MENEWKNVRRAETANWPEPEIVANVSSIFVYACLQTALFISWPEIGGWKKECKLHTKSCAPDG